MSLSEQLGGPGDVHIERHDGVPETLEDAIEYGVYGFARPGKVLLNVKGTGRFLISDGQRIEYSVEDGATDKDVAIFLHGGARAALIHQRGEIPLHAATLAHPQDNAAIAICGQSGAGKSTLAMTLITAGWRLVADDMTHLVKSDGQIMAIPSRPNIKLWQDACERFDLDIASMDPVKEGMNKFFVPVDAVGEPVPLRHVFFLDKTTFNPDAETVALSISEKFALITSNVARPRQIDPLGMSARHMKAVTEIVQAVGIHQLLGARERSPAELMQEIVDTF